MLLLLARYPYVKEEMDWDRNFSIVTFSSLETKATVDLLFPSNLFS